MATQRQGFALDPVTFEVLKNAFITTVDQMAEQILRTCYSFVIFNRDFSSALNDVNGDSIAQGNYDIAVHVGTILSLPLPLEVEIFFVIVSKQTVHPAVHSLQFLPTRSQTLTCRAHKRHGGRNV